MTKKAAALLLAASLAVSVCAMPVFAAGGTGGATTPEMGSQTGGADGAATETQVLYTVTERFTWTIPATIDFGENAGVNNTSTVEANLDGDQKGDQAKQVSGGTVWKGTAPKVCVKENVIGTGATLKINLKAKDSTAFKVKNEKNTALDYTVKTVAAKVDDTDVSTYSGVTVNAATGTDILALEAGQNKGEVTLEFVLKTEDTKKAETAGNYKDTITFTASITNT